MAGETQGGSNSHIELFPCNPCPFVPAEPRAATQEFPSGAPEEESEMITPPEPFPTYQTYAFQTEIKR